MKRWYFLLLASLILSQGCTLQQTRQDPRVLKIRQEIRSTQKEIEKNQKKQRRIQERMAQLKLERDTIRWILKGTRILNESNQGKKHKLDYLLKNILFPMRKFWATHVLYKSKKLEEKIYSDFIFALGMLHWVIGARLTQKNNPGFRPSFQAQYMLYIQGYKMLESLNPKQLRLVFPRPQKRKTFRELLRNQKQILKHTKKIAQLEKKLDLSFRRIKLIKD